MGEFLGKGYTFKTAKKRFMPNDTIEGAELAKEIGIPISFASSAPSIVSFGINLFFAVLKV